MRKSDLKKPRVNEGLADLADVAERDHEVQMARAELYKIAKHAIKLHEMLKGVSEETGLEGWVQSKITKAADYIDSVYHHLDYETKFDGEVTAAVESADYKNDLKSRLAEEAKSKAQQKLMGMALAVKRGEYKGEPSSEVKKLAKSMSEKDLEDYASTKHKGKPEHVDEGWWDEFEIMKPIDSTKDYLKRRREQYQKDMKILRSLAGDGPDAKAAEFECLGDPRVCMIAFIKKNDLDPKGITREIEKRVD